MRVKKFDWRVAILTWLLVSALNAAALGIDAVDTAILHKLFPLFLLVALMDAPGIHIIALAATLFLGHEVATARPHGIRLMVAVSLVSAKFWSVVVGFASAGLRNRHKRVSEQ